MATVARLTPRKSSVAAVFGSHRSHGEILAKGLSAINKLDDASLMHIMENFFEGTILKIVKKNFTGTVKEIGRRFLVYGTLAEIFAASQVRMSGTISKSAALRAPGIWAWLQRFALLC